MEPPNSGVVPPDKDKDKEKQQNLQSPQPTALTFPTIQITSVGGGSAPVASSAATTCSVTTLSGQGSGGGGSAAMAANQQQTQTLERLSRPMAFDKMESLVREMQDTENGVPVRSQKLFLTSIPSAFMGYDLVEWLMERLGIEESEALNIANQLCLHGYFFPVNDSKTLVVKDDSSLYRFQTPYYWPWQHKAPDNVEYAIYLEKRSMRNKQRHGLEDYESEALSSLHKNLKGKWDIIKMQAEEQVKLAKERKKGDKIVGDSQERAYWRVHRPPPGQFTPLEPCPVPSRDRQGRPRRRSADDWQREVDFLAASLGRTRMKMSQACESLVQCYEIFTEYDPLMQPALPSNPWVSEDTTFWQLNNALVDIPTEKRVKRWSISIEELVSDPTGLLEFTAYLKKEYSHENIRFWLAVNDLRRSAHSQIARKVKEIYEEFLEPGAPCEINIDSKTMEKVQQGLKGPTRFTFDAAAEHIYALLLKKDCYPRFIRSEHYKSLLASGIQPSHKKRFFGFGGAARKKASTAVEPKGLLSQGGGSGMTNPQSSLGRRRGSDRSLSGSAHELAVSGVKDASGKVPHSHSQSNLSDIPYRGDMPSGGLVIAVIAEQSEVPNKVAPTLPPTGGYSQKPKIQEAATLETSIEAPAAVVCPWESGPSVESSVSVSICPWEEEGATLPSNKSGARPKVPTQLEINKTSSDITEVSERMRRSCGIRQNTLDSDFHSTKRLMPAVTEQRRASVTIAPRLSDLQFSTRQSSLGAGISGIFASAPLPFTDHRYSTSQLSLSTATEDKDQQTPKSATKPGPIYEEARKAGKSSASGSREILTQKSPKTSIESLTVVSKESTTADVTESESRSQGVTPTISVCPIPETEHPTEEVLPAIVKKSTSFQLVKEVVEEEDDEIIKCTSAAGDDSSPPTKAFETTSPTVEGYQEKFSRHSVRQESSEDYDYDEMPAEGRLTVLPGCVAPAPTPAPSIAPLAEVEQDTQDDEADEEEASTPVATMSTPSTPGPETGTAGHQHKKRRKKRDLETKHSEDGKDDQSSEDKKSQEEDGKRNPVCPWEDE
ncbi:regulator of G-protein signaling 7 [Sergentomyia squamirostris]